ncbi:unannotated protein [freshwater metagenome]|uniref:Unannotated protein n=1 Tax=freshwater metagenome TaxID=449393 RepID=A0A6J7GF37_9ZZZZ
MCNPRMMHFSNLFPCLRKRLIRYCISREGRQNTKLLGTFLCKNQCAIVHFCCCKEARSSHLSLTRHKCRHCCLLNLHACRQTRCSGHPGSYPKYPSELPEHPQSSAVWVKYLHPSTGSVSSQQSELPTQLGLNRQLNHGHCLELDPAQCFGNFPRANPRVLGSRSVSNEQSNHVTNEHADQQSQRRGTTVDNEQKS